ncbi:hypothetical protein [Neptuniibacter caesariensis]|uniref:Uncharacterized protein n=1 Tax=Neptuniibacter caesariensis TaxID=207954 RepID=A0A7U8C7I3_NEPCE|nr:hypothetical protein [Neptuniibacter caesariensis]EAR61294.1 hypothetical protein MED92_11224 [Oceanospirillum sp. MED92] [Neptuniibacter caesariensis]
MYPSKPIQKTFNPLTQISLDASIQKHIDVLQGSESSVEALDSFYQEMLDYFSPAAQKDRYLIKLQREIVAIFRNQGVMIAVLYADMKIDCYNAATTQAINSLGEAPLTVGRIGHLLQQQLGKQLSIECFCGDRPCHFDLQKGYLYSKADIEAGFVTDDTTLEEHMCDWLNYYQQWMQDYLYFNLAQISSEQGYQTRATKINALEDSTPTLAIPAVSDGS